MSRKDTLIHEIKRELVGQLVRDVERILLDATENELEAYLSGLKAVSMTNDEISSIANSYIDDYTQEAENQVQTANQTHQRAHTQTSQNIVSAAGKTHSDISPSARKNAPDMVNSEYEPTKKDIQMVTGEKLPPKKITKNIPKPTEHKW